ncbi:MAG: TerB N-terminal domain-containing protein [Armatimonadota bacterium]|nr:TerB N-terminal domain-containing protein [bacterium]
MDLIHKLSGFISKAETIINASGLLPQHSLGKLSIADSVPPDTLQLLWFVDGPLKNYVPVENSTSFDVGPVVVTIKLGPSEPSAISMQLPVATKDVDRNSVADPSYYPTYGSLTPDQKRKYLTWLTNVDREIQIGYVFIYYYGLERHLFFGQVDDAFNMVLRLRRTHLNKSFLHYSESALIASAIFHNRPDLFMRYIETTSGAETPAVSNLYLLAKAALNIPLTPDEIVSISKRVGFTKQRYITGEAELFKSILADLLEGEYGQRSIPLSQFPIVELPKTPAIIVANISFSQDQRTLLAPNLLEYVGFQQAIMVILQSAHDTVKARLKERPKDTSASLAKPVEHISQPARHQKTREDDGLFPAINDDQFDRSVDCYNKCVCPYCDKSLPKRPEQAMKCPECGGRVRVRNNAFTGQKGFFQENEIDVLKAATKERSRRNFIYGIMEFQNISSQDIRSTQAKRTCTVEEALIETVAIRASQHHRNKDMGLCRTSMYSIGEVFMNMGDVSEALTRFLQVCFYDINGCMNAGGIGGMRKFSPSLGLVAPRVRKYILDLADKQHLSKAQLRDAFISSAEKIYETDIPLSPDKAWEKVRKELWAKV